MTVEQYLFLLRSELTGSMPQEELEDILRYYTEYFEEAGPERERDVMVELYDTVEVGTPVVMFY